MWMPPLEPGWAGKVEFYELVFGAWTSYAFLVWFWQSVLKQPLQEWRYAMLTFLGAGAFWVNHYFLKAPAWLTLINLYTVFFVFSWWWVAVRGRRSRGFGWKLLAMSGSVLYTVAFIAFEQLARRGDLGRHVTHVLDVIDDEGEILPRLLGLVDAALRQLAAG